MASPSSMNLPCFPPAFAGRLVASPSRSKWGLSDQWELSGSSRMSRTCKWSWFQSCSTLQKDISELEQPRLTQPRHRGVWHKNIGHQFVAGAWPVITGLD